MRPLILQNDPTHYAKFLNALDYVLRTADVPQVVTDHVQVLREAWATIQPKGQNARGYCLEQAVMEAGESEQVADNVLGFAWIYGDVVHGDASLLERTRSFGVVERFRAAVPLVAKPYC